jgi:cation:H+ antiporter
MMEILLLFVGLIGLWLGTEFVVRGAIRIADYFRLSQLFVGIAILAIGTDLPELVVSVNASMESLKEGVDTSGIVVGNAIGSSFSQISIVLGIMGLVSYITLARRHLVFDGIMLIGSVILLGLVGIDGQVTRVEGAILILTYVVYYYRLLNRERGGKKKESEHKDQKVWLSVLVLIIGLGVTIYTSELVVESALQITKNLGIRQSFVGIILIGLGTSLPELAVSLNAMRKKATGLSVGNLIGSNIFDALIPVGVGASISEITFEQKLIWFDLSMLLGLSILVIYFFYRKRGIQRTEAMILLFVFILYAVMKMLGQ